MIYVFGSNGKVGTALREVLTLNEEEFTPISLGDVFTVEPGSIVVNCLGYTDVDNAESDWDECKRINTDFVKTLANHCKENDCRLIHISSDYVFDGKKETGYTEADVPCPLNLYGTSKRNAELEIFDSRCESTIVRTSWLYGGIGKSFPIKIIENLRDGSAFNVDDDIYCTPTSVKRLVDFIYHDIIVNNLYSTLVHYSGFYSISLYQFARLIKDFTEFPVMINPVHHQNNPSLAYRPKNTSLFTFNSSISVPDFFEDVKEYIRSIT